MFDRIDLWTKFNHLEEKVIDRQEQLRMGNEHRQSFEERINGLTEWNEAMEEQLRDPPSTALQESSNGLKEKHQLIKVESVEEKFHSIFNVGLVSLSIG